MGKKLPKGKCLPEAAQPRTPRIVSHSPTVCARFHRAIELIGRRWTGAILFALTDGGALRFSELKERVPDLSDRLLSERLKELEDHGIVSREVVADRPVHVTYRLTPVGLELRPILLQIQQWAGKLDIPDR
jgi:DNA-binding HxlR family transcriptional regulator